MNTPAEIPFQRVLDALLDADTLFPPRYLHRLSDLDTDELSSLSSIWDQVPAWRRQALLEDVVGLGEADLLLSFDGLARAVLGDAEARVRQLAVEILWEYDQTNLIPIFIRLLSSDPASTVRAAAATALGRFVYEGEVDDIPAQQAQKIEELLLSVINATGEDEVRRAALESLGYSGRKEVAKLIETAYSSGETDWIASALFAMGRSTNKRWKPDVLAKLDDKMPAIRLEAARAAGELEIQAARPRLYNMLDDPDQDTRLASIWSLSQLGGKGVREALERLLIEADTDDERAYMQEALDNLEFSEEIRLMPIIAIPDETLLEDLEDDDVEWNTDDELLEENDEEDELD